MRTVSPDDTILEAVEELCRWHVRAVIVGSPSNPLGILCERDVLERVVRPRRDPEGTTVSAVMTTPLVSLPASATPEEALLYMREVGVHQIPVAGDEAIIGVVSATDLRRWALRMREGEVRALTSYVMGG